MLASVFFGHVPAFLSADNGFPVRKQYNERGWTKMVPVQKRSPCIFAERASATQTRPKDPRFAIGPMCREDLGTQRQTAVPKAACRNESIPTGAEDPAAERLFLGAGLFDKGRFHPKRKILTSA